MSTRFEKYWTESGRGDGQGDVEKKDHQSYRRPYMMGKARGKDEDINIDIMYRQQLCNQRRIFSHIIEMNNKGILHFTFTLVRDEESDIKV